MPGAMAVGMKLISLFDGIGGFPLAWCNVTGQAPADLQYQSSEIEPWPMAVVRQRFPHVEELGDVTGIQGDGLRATDDHIITFGSPCQDLSVAGRGAGLAGERSGLYHEAMRLVRDIRPRYFIWENVAGAFSSNNGDDFARVLQSIADIGDYEAVWTTLDAQWCGVPQRRRRIFLLGVRDGIPAGADIFSFGRRATEVCRDKVQLIRESRSRNTATSGEAGQGTAADAGGGFTAGSFGGYEPGVGTLRSGGGELGGGSETLAVTCGAYPLANPDPLDAEGGATSDKRQIVATTGDCTHALTARGDSSEDGTGRGTPIVAAGSFWDGGQVSQCIDARVGRGQTMPEKGRFPAVITHNNKPWPAEVAEPLNAHFGDKMGLEDQRALGAASLFVPAPVIRRLTPVECLRLQGFPDDWFEGVPGYSDTKAYRAVGNSVAIPCVEWIFQQVLKFDKTQE